MVNSVAASADQNQRLRIAVTGAAGYIGRAVCQRLRELGYDVVEFDIRDADLAAENVCLKGCHAVVHLAANPSVVASIQDPAGDARSIIAAIRVARSAHQAGCRFVFASSCAMYGNDQAACIGSDLKPVSPYGISKRAAEEYLRWFVGCGLKVSILRLGNVYGGDDVRGVWPRFRAAKAADEPATIYGDGLATRSYVAIDQVVDALIEECHAVDSCRLRNLGGPAMSVNDIAKSVGVQAVHKPARPGEASICVLVQ